MTENRLYQQEIMEEYQNSRYRRAIDNPDIRGYMINPSCGDAVTFQMKIADARIVDVGFQGSGCVISQATASIMCGFMMCKSLVEIQAMTADDLLKLIKIPLGPTRIRCALLSLQALHLALDTSQKNG